MQVQVEVAEGCYALLDACASLVGVIQSELKNGWDPLKDIPAIIAEGIKDLGVVAMQRSKVVDELANHKDLVINAVCVGGAKIVNKVAL